MYVYSSETGRIILVKVIMVKVMLIFLYIMQCLCQEKQKANKENNCNFSI